MSKNNKRYELGGWGGPESGPPPSPCTISELVDYQTYQEGLRKQETPLSALPEVDVEVIDDPAAQLTEPENA